MAFKIILFVNIFMMLSQEVKVFRDLFQTASGNEASCKKLFNLTLSQSQDPIKMAYHAASIMAMAEHVFWPMEKLNYFNKGRELLEKSVSWAPNNIEVRWIRYMIQKHAPAFLGYRQHLKSDAEALKNFLSEVSRPSDPDLVQRIKESLP